MHNTGIGWHILSTMERKMDRFRANNVIQRFHSLVIRAQVRLKLEQGEKFNILLDVSLVIRGQLCHIVLSHRS